jgi:hypothetical protein
MSLSAARSRAIPHHPGGTVAGAEAWGEISGFPSHQPQETAEPAGLPMGQGAAQRLDGSGLFADKNIPLCEIAAVGASGGQCFRPTL